MIHNLMNVRKSPCIFICSYIYILYIYNVKNLYFFIIIYMYMYSAYSTTVSYFAILHMHTRAYPTMCRDYALLYLYIII